MKDKCECNCCSIDGSYSDYDDIIEQLKETRDSIDKMIKALEHRKVKDNVINDILNTEYEDDDENNDKDKNALEDIINDMMKNTKVHTYTIPFDPTINIRYKYPFRYYPYFKY